MLVAGTAGMSLATVIRLEFAYPGVGVLAGDSLQYLSTATAHGVIMVFYMIMPAIFGAFGNFLLPTQLGVHDVAFPRLNSAAFWFLPGGLIMLCQLVCTDRRYARMNCFNIRELQGVLKRKFFVDLVNSHDHRSILGESMVGLRYRSNQSLNLELDSGIFYNYGLHTKNFLGYVSYSTDLKKNSGVKGRVFIDSLSYSLLRVLDFSKNTENYKGLSFRSFGNFNLRFYNIIQDLVLLLSSVSFFSIRNIFDYKILLHSMLSNFFSLYTFISHDLLKAPNTSLPYAFKKNSFVFQRSNGKNMDEDCNIFMESSSKSRFSRFYNPLINYDYKTGNYIGSWESQYPQLINSFIEVARGIRKPN